MKKSKKILFIIATHGNERVGFETVKMLRKRGYGGCFDYLIANPKAFEKNKRFIDVDLNRSYPGKKYSKAYEKRMAYRNIEIAKKYSYVIDMHEASEGTNDFIIVPKKRFPKKFPLSYVNLDKVLLWPYPKGSMSQILENSIELELGAKNRNRKDMINKAVCVAENFICNIDDSGGIIYRNKKTFYVYGVLRKNDLEKNKKLIDFKKTEVNGEKFLPLLVNQYIDLGIICYKMKSVMR